MKDLDFDELDRAVNSLMANATKSKPQVNSVTPTSSTVSNAQVREGEKSEPVATSVPSPSSSVPSSTPPPSPVPSVAMRRGGRFMDVVHPSSTMKKTTTPDRSVSRQGTSIAPPSSLEQTQKASGEASKEEDRKPAVAASASTSATITEKSAPANDWPDPLEMANFKDEEDEPIVKKVEEKTDSQDDKNTTPSLPSKEEDEPSPLASPFLPGTKVEKRPLGSMAPFVAEEPDRPPILGIVPGADTSDNAEAQLPAVPLKAEPELPEELRGDLVAVEADGGAWIPPKVENKKGDEDEAAVQSLEHEDKEEKVLTTQPSKPAGLSHRDEDETPKQGPTSIPQQYHEQPSTTEQTNGSIYDTNSYHQPLTHPAKKKSGWMWVLWILLILILGAGAGAGLYFSGIV